ncbi:MAG: hypothetical protein AB8U40_01780 [Anaplasma ovis]
MRPRSSMLQGTACYATAICLLGGASGSVYSFCCCAGNAKNFKYVDYGRARLGERVRR